MRRKKVDSSKERRLLIGMITNRTVCAAAARSLDPALIDAPHFRQVAEWCINYFNEYSEPPGPHIEDIYAGWADDNENVDLVDGVHDFLEALSQEHGEKYEGAEDLNAPYLLDELGAFVAKRCIQRLQDDLDYAMHQGDVKAAEELVQGYRRVEVGEASSCDPFNDREGWIEAFATPVEPLLVFPGDAGTFFNPALTRDALVGVQAPEKTGKTMWCIEFVMRALQQRRRVAFFQTGDLTKPQLYRRLGVRLAGLPMYKWQLGTVEVPVKVVRDPEEDAGYRMKVKREVLEHTFSFRSTVRGLRQFKQRAFGKQRAAAAKPRSYLRTAFHANSTISVAGIHNELLRWKHEHGFVPDVIVIDYADILAPESGRLQGRDIENARWMALRRLSQQWHCLVIVPTQADAAAYGNELKLQSMKNYSEDKRKLAHVTAMLGLNQTPDEKEFGGMRLNWIVLREAPFNIQRPLYVGGCYTLARALCCASF